MATDKYPDVKELTIKKGPIISFVASSAIPMWSPVIVTAPAVATRLPRVGTTTTTNDPKVIGVAVGGSGDVAGTGKAADAAGDVVDVAIIGSGAIVKCKVDGNANNISIGDALVTDATAGQAESVASVTADTDAYTLGKALFASTVNGDTIPIILMGGGR